MRRGTVLFLWITLLCLWVGWLAIKAINRFDREREAKYLAAQRAICARIMQPAWTSSDSILALSAHPRDERGVTCADILP